MALHLPSLIVLTLYSLSTVHSDYVDGYWTYSPSFEAMSSLKGVALPKEGEDNLFLIPERNSLKIGNNTIYSCKICDWRSPHADKYAEHAKEKHFFPGHEADHQWLKDLAKRQDFNFTCNVCGEIYKTEMALLWHMTKYEHVIDDHDKEIAKYLRARIQLNETVDRKVVYHSLVRPFYRLEEPSNETHAQSDLIQDLCDGYQKQTFAVPASQLSSGDISNQFHDESIIKTGYSKYQKSDVEKRFKKINGVNVYQRSPEVKEYVETDEEGLEKQEAAINKRREERRARKRAYEMQNTEELMKREMKEEEESEHSASYYRRQLDEYGPWADHSDKVGDRKLRKVTKIVRVTKLDVNRKDPQFKRRKK